MATAVGVINELSIQIMDILKNLLHCTYNVFLAFKFLVDDINAQELL